MDSDQVAELLGLQNDDGIKPIHGVRNEMMWLDTQVSAKYSKLAVVAQQTLLPFPTTYLIEYTFCSVTGHFNKETRTLGHYWS